MSNLVRHQSHHYVTWCPLTPTEGCPHKFPLNFWESEVDIVDPHAVPLDRKSTVELAQHSAIVRLDAMPCTNSLHSVSIRCNTQSGTAASQTLLVAFATVYKDWAFCHVGFCLSYSLCGMDCLIKEGSCCCCFCFFCCCCRLLQQLEVSWSGSPFGSSTNTHC